MSKQVCADLGRLKDSASGAVAIEYALIMVLIVLVLISLHQQIGNAVVGFFMSAANGL